MEGKVDDDVTAMRRIIDANSYMTLATADASGSPWATPVWFAHDQTCVEVSSRRVDNLHVRHVTRRKHRCFEQLRLRRELLEPTLG